MYDTVIIDDASMVSEADTVTALKHGCQRAVLLGNQMLT
jgi:superfamily I DNA and/or RNA helicase